MERGWNRAEEKGMQKRFFDLFDGTTPDTCGWLEFV